MRAHKGGGRLRPALSLLAAAICTAGVVALAGLAVGTLSGQRLDQLILSGAQAIEDSVFTRMAEFAVGAVSLPASFALLVLAVLLVLLRRRARVLFPLALLVGGANLTTQALKHLVVTREALGPGIDVTPNSFPSGHATLAASAVIALVLASGRARGLLALPGAGWIAAVGLGTLVVGWHRPSDVIGAVLVVAVWTFLVLALDGMHTAGAHGRRDRDPGHGRRRAGTPARSAGGGSVPAEAARPRPRVTDLTPALILGVAGLAGVGLGIGAMTDVDLPLMLDDAAQQTAAFTATAALLGGGTAVWLALTLALRTPG